MPHNSRQPEIVRYPYRTYVIPNYFLNLHQPSAGNVLPNYFPNIHKTHSYKQRPINRRAVDHIPLERGSK